MSDPVTADGIDVDHLLAEHLAATAELRHLRTQLRRQEATPMSYSTIIGLEPTATRGNTAAGIAICDDCGAAVVLVSGQHDSRRKHDEWHQRIATLARQAKGLEPLDRSDDVVDHAARAHRL